LAVGCFCIGTNQVDLQAAATRGIAVFNSPFSNTRSVAELIIGQIINLARQLGDRNMEMHRGVWKKTAKGCYEIRGKTLGIVGYGHIGSQLSVIAESLGMQVIFYDIIAKLALGNSRPTKDLEVLLKTADFFSLHVPETEETKGMIKADQLKLMKKGSFLLNASRGTVVDIDALAASLRSGHLGGAYVDVFPEEPEKNSNDWKIALQGIPNVLMTPHVGGSTEEAQAAIGVEVAGKLVNFTNNGSTDSVSNLPEISLPSRKNAHRILNIHKNVPGVLKQINTILSDFNVLAQILSTHNEIGYYIADVDKVASKEIKERIAELPTSIKTRILY